MLRLSNLYCFLRNPYPTEIVELGLEYGNAIVLVIWPVLFIKTREIVFCKASLERVELRGSRESSLHTASKGSLTKGALVDLHGSLDLGSLYHDAIIGLDSVMLRHILPLYGSSCILQILLRNGINGLICFSHDSRNHSVCRNGF